MMMTDHPVVSFGSGGGGADGSPAAAVGRGVAVVELDWEYTTFERRERKSVKRRDDRV